jgi:hypothetical protein
MAFLTSFYAFLFYFAAFVLVAGLARKIIQYARTPAPLKIPTTPAPTTRTGVVFRMMREVVLFESLFRGNKWTWIFGWMFHFGLFLVTLASSALFHRARCGSRSSSSSRLASMVASPWSWG